MSSKKPSGSKKDPLKTPKVWEKNRREKMKNYFQELQEVLPFYDPSAPMSRFEILQKARSYIKDLQEQNQDLLNGGFDEVYKIKMMKLKQRVKELLKRVDQLTDLLRTANIMIPPIEAYSEGSKNLGTFKWMSQQPKKWTEKINLVVPDDEIKNILALIKEQRKISHKKVKLKKKQNDKLPEKSDLGATSGSPVQRVMLKKKKLLKKSSKLINLRSIDTVKSTECNFSELESSTQSKENQPVDFNSLSNSSENKNKSNISVTSHIITDKGTKTLETNNSNQNSSCAVSVNNKVTLPQNVVLPTVPNILQPNTYILTNDGNLVHLPIFNSSPTVFNSSTNLLTPTAVVKPNGELVTSLIVNKPSPVLVLQKSTPPQIFQTAQIINATPQIIVSKPTFQVFEPTNKCASISSISAVKTLPHILCKTPVNKKRIARDSTVTTYVNKIPIPALSKQSYSKKSDPVNASKKETILESKTKQVPENADKNSEALTENDNINDKNQANKSENQALPETNKEILKTKESELNISEKVEKRSSQEDFREPSKKAKVDKTVPNITEENVFKPIESESTDVFCNLALPNSGNPSLSVSPTAAFLSTFPIVTAVRPETDDDVVEKKSDEEKNPKAAEQSNAKGNKETNIKPVDKLITDVSKAPSKESSSCIQSQTETHKKVVDVTTDEQTICTQKNSVNSINSVENKHVNEHHLPHCKSWEQFHQETSEAFFMATENMNNADNSLSTLNSSVNYPESYKNYPVSAQIKTSVSLSLNSNETQTIQTSNFQCMQKENYLNKTAGFNERSVLAAKNCNSGNMIDNFSIAKTVTNYQNDPGPSYQLVPTKEIPAQRNAKTVNWMTEPDSNRVPAVYNTQNDKVNSGKASSFVESNFYINNQNSKITTECSGLFMNNEQNKANYQKNEFYGKDQRCKNIEKRSDTKCYSKSSQNSYNIFEYNYSPSCYGDDSNSKYCHNQSYSSKVKKNMAQTKKKPESQVNEISTEPLKRPSDPPLTNIDFTSQECFTWVPGKNVDWLPSKSFCLDSNLVVPSTLPTLVGDLALGTPSNSDVSQKTNTPSKVYHSSMKPSINDPNKDYVDGSLGTSQSKSIESVDNTNKQYFEPFTNLSKNIFDVTNSNVSNLHMSKNEYDKINFVGNNNNETIVLKNIFELPVSKSSNTDFPRNKQRTIPSSQNTFLSVSQLVEPSVFEGSSIKSDNQESSSKTDHYAQTYPNYNSQKTYKNKTRSSNCKFSDRKYHGYKNSSSSYTAEALIRSNSNASYQPNEFSLDISSNFYNTKPNQKPEQFPSTKIDFDINMKGDFTTPSSQNIYSDFNFSSPVPNFGIGPTVGTDFGSHENTGNLSAQNNSFFGDFITPEYSVTDNVSNSLFLPQCSIGLQNPFVVDKRSSSVEKNKTKNCTTSRRKHYDCTKSNYNEFTLTPSNAIFTTSNISCPTIFTTSCQNLLTVPSQSIPISFSSPTFTTSNIPFPALSTATNNNYHRFPNSQNNTTGSFLTSNPMFTTCTSKPFSTSHSCYSSNTLTSVTNAVIPSSFPVGNVPLPSTSQSSIPFFSLSNPIIPSAAPTSSSNSLANFNLSTIFPEINQKGNYQYS